MRIRTPSYYRQFRCTASACGESCCVGWDICIDPETAGRYRTLPGPLGARLRREICWQDPPRFRLRPDSRCPFLNADGLCSLILEAGEGALCEICAEHPRFHNDYGPLRESGLGLCCEEAARLILFSTESPLSFDVRETPEAGGPAPEQLDALLEARETALRLACCPAHSMEERFLLLLALGADVQDRLDEGGSPAEASRPYREEGFRIRALEQTGGSGRAAPPGGGRPPPPWAPEAAPPTLCSAPPAPPNGGRGGRVFYARPAAPSWARISPMSPRMHRARSPSSPGA